MMHDVMLDLETLGTRPGCTVLSIGAVAFDAATGLLGPEFHMHITRESCEAAGLLEDTYTLAWWDEQSDAAKQVFKECAQGERLFIALGQFGEYLETLGGEQVRVWGNGADFDNAILAHCYAVVGMRTPWAYNKSRCYRTLKSLHPQIEFVSQGVHHNALDDAKSQAMHAMQILKQYTTPESTK